RKLTHAASNVGACADDNGAILCRNEVIATKTGIGLYPLFLTNKKIFYLFHLVLIEIESTECHHFDGIIEHGNLVRLWLKDHFPARIPARIQGFCSKVTLIDAESKNFPGKGNAKAIVLVEGVVQKEGIE